MKRAAAILLGVALVCLVAYVSWLNPAAVEFHLTPTYSVHGPLAAFIVFALVVGAVAVLAVVMMQAGRRAFVAWRLDRAQRRSERIDAWEERGEELVWNGDVQRGRALLQKAWQRRPDNPHALLALTLSYQDTGELQRARQLLAGAIGQHHTNPDILLALAEAHHASGERAACVEVLERLRALHPQAPRVLRALRDVYVEAQRWSDAAALQETLLGQLPDRAEATRERDYVAGLRYQAGLSLTEPAARARALGALADSRGGSVPVLVSLGDALLADGRGDEASVLWERALRTRPRTVFVERLARIATEPHHRERLRTLLRRLRPEQVRSEHVHLVIAQLYLADGRLDDAARELEALQNPGAAPALLHRLWADVHRRRGQLEQAVKAYAHAEGAVIQHRCSVCERSVKEWTGYCPQCGHWDSYRSDVEIALA